MTLTREQLLIAALTAGEVTHFYSMLEPSPFTIESFVRTPQAAATIERNLVYAGLGAVAFGLVIGQLIGSSAPVFFAIGTVIVVSMVYRAALVRAVAAA